MGEEIIKSRFRKKDYDRYTRQLTKETEILRKHFETNQFGGDLAMGGFEQEAWIVDKKAFPSPNNSQLLQRMPDHEISPELSKFNFELNVTPQLLAGNGLRKMYTELANTWKTCQEILHQQNDKAVMIGILPTVDDSHLILENMSLMNRYRALNEQVMLARKGVPLKLDINGREHLLSEHRDVMLESAATSFQIHRQIPGAKSKRYYNAAIIASSPLVAVSANSPYLFHKDVWDETRIPVFEQSVEIGGYGDAANGPMRRVSFGSGYVQRDVFECFQENLAHFPILLPVELEADADKLPHLRLHNGTIWRWNRPLIGFDKNGELHLRIEHRVIAAGPTLIDEMANAAFFFGLQEYLASCEVPPESQLEFSVARNNFYEAARLGLRAKAQWFSGNKRPMNQLVLDELLPMARQGLKKLAMDADDIEAYLSIIELRTRSGQNGASWQRAFVEKNGRDMQALTLAYFENQESEKPVHLWDV